MNIEKIVLKNVQSCKVDIPMLKTKPRMKIRNLLKNPLKCFCTSMSTNHWSRRLGGLPFTWPAIDSSTLDPAGHCNAMTSLRLKSLRCHIPVSDAFLWLPLSNFNCHDCWISTSLKFLYPISFEILPCTLCTPLKQFKTYNYLLCKES